MIYIKRELEKARIRRWKQVRFMVKALGFICTILWLISNYWFTPTHYESPVKDTRDIMLTTYELREAEEKAIKEYEAEKTKLRIAEAEAKKEESIKKLSAPEEVEAMVRKYFGDKADEALICFKSESGLRPTAVNYSNRNGSWDIGLAQVNTIHCAKVKATSKTDCRDKLLDLETNIKVAKQIWDGRGWNAWYGKSCKPMWK